MRHDQPNGIVIFIVGEMLVGMNPVMPVVQRFHPIIVQPEVPLLAFRWHDFNQEGLALRNRPMAVIIGDVGIAAGGQ